MFKCFSVVGSLHYQFYKPVYPLQLFWVETKCFFVDRKWWFVEQKLVTSKGVHCVSLVKMIFKEKNGKTISGYNVRPELVSPVFIIFY